MLRKSIVSCVAVVLCVLAFSAHVSAQTPNTLITLTNQQRTATGIKPLTENAELMASAQAKAQDMLTDNYWAHYAPDGTSPWDFIRATGYNYTRVGENLAEGFTNDSSVVAAWMQSPGHRKNILDPSFEDVGIAAVDGWLLGHKTTLVVAHYGKLQPAPTYKEIRPTAHQQQIRTTADHRLWIVQLQKYREHANY